MYLQSADLGILNPWLRNIRDVYRWHVDELRKIEDETEKYNRLVELNVQEQCMNVLKAAEVQRAITADRLAVHGWVLDIGSGRIIDLKIDFDRLLEQIQEIYRIT